MSAAAVLPADAAQAVDLSSGERLQITSPGNQVGTPCATDCVAKEQKHDHYHISLHTRYFSISVRLKAFLGAVTTTGLP